MKRQIPSCNRDALTRIFAMRSYTRFLQKPKKKTKKERKTPKQKQEYLEKNHKTKEKKTRLKKRKEQHRVSIEPTPPEAQRL